MGFNLLPVVNLSILMVIAAATEPVGGSSLFVSSIAGLVVDPVAGVHFLGSA